MKYFLLAMALLFSSFTLKAERLDPCMESTCKETFKLYKSYAKKGYAEALSSLAEMYYHGYGTKQDTQKAVKSFRRGAKYGSTAAQFKLGYLYLKDANIRDIDEGIKYLKKAAKNKHKESMYTLGVAYYEPEFGLNDFDKADYWLSKAYDGGYIRAKKYIQHIGTQSAFNNRAMPEVAGILMDIQAHSTDQSQLAKIEPEQSNSAEQEIEVLEVRGPSLQEIFQYELMSFKLGSPEKYNVGTGTKIIGRSCEKMISCNTINKDQYVIFLSQLPYLDGLN